MTTLSVVQNLSPILPRGRVYSSRAMRGLSLIELLIALGLGLFLLAGIVTLVVSVSQTRIELSKTSEQIENGRYATQLLSDDLHNAGFYGVPQPLADVHTTPSPCVTTATISDLLFGYVAPDTTKVSVPVPVFGYAASATLPTCLTDAKTGSEALVVRYVCGIVKTSAGDTALACDRDNEPVAGDVPYVQTSANLTLDSPPNLVPAQAIVVGKTSSAFVLHTKDAVATLAPVRRYVVRTYYLSSCDVCSGTGTDTIPTLKMAELTGDPAKPIQSTPVVEGIEDLHFEYGVDTNNDGVPDSYLDASAVTNWTNVTAVKIHLLARSINTTPGWTDTRTYDMGRGTTRTSAFNDHYKRQVYTLTVSINNVRGARE